MKVVFEAELWIWEARPSETWTFVALTPADSDAITDRAGGLSNGFGSLRVRATVGDSTWKTSIFPDKGRGTYVLPVKKAIRTAEALEVGDRVAVAVELLEL
jgi:hypothetical protein